MLNPFPTKSPLTTICLYPHTRKLLEALKTHQKESMDSILIRLINSYTQQFKEEKQ